MRLVIKGGNKEDRAQVRQEVKWFINRIMSPSIRKNLNLYVSIKRNLKKSEGYRGLCVWKYDNHNPRDFDIELEATLTTFVRQRIIAHECWHVKQFVDGYLKDLVRPEYAVKWYSRVFEDGEIAYENQPWEKEADRKSKTLAKEYRDFQKLLQKYQVDIPK